jgi:hypothetical protein
MNIDDDRFEPLPTEGGPLRRLRDLDDTAVSGVEGIGGSVHIIAYSSENGMSYEQTEPVGENYHRYRNSGWERQT